MNVNSIPSLPANIDPRIAEILRQRAEKGVVITQTVPAKPQPRTPVVASTKAEVPAETPLDDTELAGILGRILPAADALIRKAILAVKGDGKLTLAEALALAPEIRNIVSEVVGKLVPEVRGTSARELVILVLAALLEQYVAPRIPAIVRPYLTAKTLRQLVKGLEFAYVTWIKPKLGK